MVFNNLQNQKKKGGDVEGAHSFVQGLQKKRKGRTVRKRPRHQTGLQRSRPKRVRARATFLPPARGGTCVDNASPPRRASSFQKRLLESKSVVIVRLKRSEGGRGGKTRTDVAGTDLLSDLNVRAVDRAEEKTTVQAKLHVGRTRRLRTRGRDVLTDVRGRYQYFGQGHGVVGKEEDAKVVLCVRVNVDDTGDIHDEANGLGGVVQRMGYKDQKESVYQFGDIILWLSCQYVVKLDGRRTYSPGQLFQQRRRSAG